MAAVFYCERCHRTVKPEDVIRVKGSNGVVLHFCEPDCLVNFFIDTYKLAFATEVHFKMPKKAA